MPRDWRDDLPDPDLPPALARVLGRPPKRLPPVDPDAVARGLDRHQPVPPARRSVRDRVLFGRRVEPMNGGEQRWAEFHARRPGRPGWGSPILWIVLAVILAALLLLGVGVHLGGSLADRIRSEHEQAGGGQ